MSARSRVAIMSPSSPHTVHTPGPVGDVREHVLLHLFPGGRPRLMNRPDRCTFFEEIIWMFTCHFCARFQNNISCIKLAAYSTANRSSAALR